MLVEVVMGGIGSGARRSKHFGDVEDVPALDIRTLRRLDVVRAGECVCDNVRWAINGLSASSARLRVDLSDIKSGGMMTINGDMPTGPTNQRIAINVMPSAIGGWRCYFICPITAKRCEVLYYAGGRFASRQGQRLTYATQNMTDLSRASRKATKLRARLCGSGVLPRPRGRNRIGLAKRVHDAEREMKAMYHDRLSAIVERSDAPRMPKAT